MLYIIGTLIAVSVILFIMSYFMNDRFNEVEEQIEQLSISTSQDIQFIKNKFLEAEANVSKVQAETSQNKTTSKIDNHVEEPLKNQKVYHLHQQGYSIEDIAQRTELTEDEISKILKLGVKQ